MERLLPFIFLASAKNLSGILHARKFLLFLFCFSLSGNLSATEHETADNSTNEGIIYVTKGAAVYGETNTIEVKVGSVSTKKEEAIKLQVVKKSPVSIVTKKESKQLQDLQQIMVAGQ